MSRPMIAIQVRGAQARVLPVPSSSLEQSVNRSLRASFSLEGSNVSNASWAKMNDAARFLTKIA